MCDNCPSKTVENKAEWTRETAKPTGERPLPVPSGRSKDDEDDPEAILEYFHSATLSIGNPMNQDGHIDLANETLGKLRRWHQAVIDAAVKEALDYAVNNPEEFDKHLNRKRISEALGHRSQPQEKK